MRFSVLRISHHLLLSAFFIPAFLVPTGIAAQSNRLDSDADLRPHTLDVPPCDRAVAQPLGHSESEQQAAEW